MTGRPDAPELSAAELRFLDRPDAPESLRERVAVAMYEADEAHAEETDYDFHEPIEWRYNHPARDDYRRRADAALAVVRGEQ